MAAIDDTQPILDSSDLRRYRIEIPNLVDDSELDVYAFRLYARYKRVAGQRGTCFQSVRTLAAACRMSIGMICKARQTLIQRGFVTKTTVTIEGKQLEAIRIVDIWTANMNRYLERSPHEQSVHHMNTEEQKRSSGEQERSLHEQKCSPGELKKEHSKKEPTKKKYSQSRAALPEIPLPDSFREFNVELRAIAAPFAAKGLDVEMAHENFVGRADRDGLLYKDWRGAFRVSLTNALKWAERDGTLRVNRNKASQVDRSAMEAQLAQKMGRSYVRD